jgi:hypothetical protein
MPRKFRRLRKPRQYLKKDKRYDNLSAIMASREEKTAINTFTPKVDDEALINKNDVRGIELELEDQQSYTDVNVEIEDTDITQRVEQSELSIPEDRDEINIDLGEIEQQNTQIDISNIDLGEIEQQNTQIDISNIDVNSQNVYVPNLSNTADVEIPQALIETNSPSLNIELYSNFNMMDLQNLGIRDSGPQTPNLGDIDFSPLNTQVTHY